jgi:hypothetical protein
MKAKLIHADRQKDLHEANWLSCDCAKAHKLHVPGENEDLQGNVSVVLN